jgi:hypothetical protein
MGKINRSLAQKEVLRKNYLAVECPDYDVQTFRLNEYSLQCTEKVILSREAYLQPGYCESKVCVRIAQGRQKIVL